MNDIYTTNVKILGEGTPIIYELESNDMEYIDFKEVSIGLEYSKKIKLLNKSKIELNVDLFEGRKGELENNFITYIPNSFKVKPKHYQEIEIKFLPKTRVPKFVSELNIKVQG